MKNTFPPSLIILPLVCTLQVTDKNTQNGVTQKMHKKKNRYVIGERHARKREGD